MKKIYLAIGIVVILAIVCSPALAISKSDLIASYPRPGDDSKDGSVWIYIKGSIKPTPSPTMVSQADLIASYKGQPSPTILTPLYPAPSSPTGFIWVYTGKGSLPKLIPTSPPISDEEWKEMNSKIHYHVID
jgi:hypothetical protein